MLINKDLITTAIIQPKTFKCVTSQFRLFLEVTEGNNVTSGGLDFLAGRVVHGPRLLTGSERPSPRRGHGQRLAQRQPAARPAQPGQDAIRRIHHRAGKLAAPSGPPASFPAARHVSGGVNAPNAERLGTCVLFPSTVQPPCQHVSGSRTPWGQGGTKTHPDQVTV